MNEPPDWHVLADLAPQVRAEFDSECLVEYETTKWSPVLWALRSDPSLIQPRTVDLKQEVLEGVFGAFEPHHAFNAFTPDWGIRLIERQATGGLSHLLNRGEPKLRAARIRAFLEALKVPCLPDDRALERASVFAERDNIDLEIQFPVAAGSQSLRIVIVEAKFESKLRKGHKFEDGHRIGQLSTYYNSRKDDSRFVEPDCRIIGLTPGAGKGRTGQQFRIWPVYLWRDVWLQFEKRRPKETDGQLAAFMALLWQRIGGLTSKL